MIETTTVFACTKGASAGAAAAAICGFSASTMASGEVEARPSSNLVAALITKSGGATPAFLSSPIRWVS